MKVICEECKREFEMTQDKLKESYIGAMLTEVYYHCPNCNKKHIVGVMNAKCRRLKRAMQIEIMRKFASNNNIDLILQDKKIDDIQKALHHEINRINGK
ncbi:hypothetical protein [Clostridium sp. YIM B02551]|uniref:hypothetical protein n=1 Tax=Clostridium sp. YIM B02551 TaxID=2910679 RepID=UPI001EE9B95C|nr:hypothetical protein [Clostridium sp. YIM B02551]